MESKSTTSKGKGRAKWKEERKKKRKKEKKKERKKERKKGLRGGNYSGEYESGIGQIQDGIGYYGILWDTMRYDAMQYNGRHSTRFNTIPYHTIR